jgi:hypothetical protein
MVEAAMSPGRIRPRLVVIWTLLGALIAAIVVMERNDLFRSQPVRDDGHGHWTGDTRWLLPAPIEQIGAIEVAHAGVVHRFERDSSGTWFYHGPHTGQEGEHEHRSDPVTAAKIEHALAGFGRTRIERTFPLDFAAVGVDPAERELMPDPGVRDYGVTVPSTIVLVYAPGSQQPWVQYAVGDVAPDGLSRYVLPVGRTTVATVANYQITNLLDLVDALGSAPLPDSAARSTP